MVQFAENVEDNEGKTNRSGAQFKSVILTPEKKLTSLMLKLLIFIEGLTHNGTGVLANIYLVAIADYTPLEASTVWIIREIVRIIYHPLIGDVVDRVKIHKYTILIMVAILKIASGVCMVTTTNFGVMCFKSVMDGVVEASFLAAVTAMSLGVAGKTRFHKKVAAQNNIVKFVGVSIGSAIFGFVSYAVWPKVEGMYWILVGCGCLMLLCTLFMLQDSNAVDDRLARGRSVRILAQSITTIRVFQNFVDEFNLDSDDEEDDEKEELMKRRAAVRQSQITVTADERDNKQEEAIEEQAPDDAESYTQVMTYRQMYADPKRRNSLIFLSLVLFTYHVANSTTAPLLGQYMAKDAGQNGLPIATGLILTNSLSKVFTTWILQNDRASIIGYKKCLLIGSTALCIRLILITIFVNYWANPWALGATQVLDGIGGGCLSLMLMLYSHLLSRRTGHFNLNMGIVNSWKVLGTLVGVLVGGAIATAKSYLVAFPILCGISIFPVLFSFGVSTPDLKRMD